MEILLAVAIAGLVLFLAFGPIMRTARRVELDPSVFTATTGRMLFRNPEAADRQTLIGLYNDPVTQAANHWNEDVVKTTVELLRSPTGFAEWASVSMVGVRRSDGEMVGLATLGTESGPGREGLSIGLQMVPAFRGQGYATELLAAMISSTRELTDGDVWIGTATDNEPIIHMMKSLGYAPEANTAPYAAPNGTAVASHWYQVGAGAPAPDFTP